VQTESRDVHVDDLEPQSIERRNSGEKEPIERKVEVLWERSAEAPYFGSPKTALLRQRLGLVEPMAEAAERCGPCSVDCLSISPVTNATAEQHSRSGIAQVSRGNRVQGSWLQYIVGVQECKQFSRGAPQTLVQGV